MDSKKKALLALQALNEKKASQPLLLSLEGLTLITDFFLICHGNSPVHVKALADAVAEAMEKDGLSPLGVEGYQEARWVLMDYGDLVVHIFAAEEREFYSLEELWGDAQRLEVAASAAPWAALG